ncbi:MAG: hypothetical protein KTR31_23375 [Myxococcales bacterium]|nr:hypothetical protein [Myxococcales bacterium]
MASVPTDFGGAVDFYVEKCRQYLRRTELTYRIAADVLASEPEASLVQRYGQTVADAVGSTLRGPTGRERLERVLARSHLSTQKANFELFLNRIAAAKWEFHLDQVLARWPHPIRVPSDSFLRPAEAGAPFSVAELNVPSMGLSDLVGHLKVICGINGLSFSQWAGLSVPVEAGQLRVDLWSQVVVSFQVRHLFEHRDGRVSRAFRNHVTPYWSRSSWGGSKTLEDLAQRDATGRAVKVGTRALDFLATTEAMVQGAERIGRAMGASEV